MRTHLPGPDYGFMDPAPAWYVIEIRGHLGVTLLSAFPALVPQPRGADTVLTGLLDRSALYGVLRSRRSASTSSRSASSYHNAGHQDQVTAAHLDGR